GAVVGDVVGFVGTGSFASAGAGTGIAVTPSLTLTGADALNYTLTQPSGLTGDITKANQTITFAALASKSQADAPFALTGTASSGLTVSYASSNTAVATVSGNTVTIVGIGTTTITASQAGDGNFNAATSVDQSLTVTAGPTTLAAGDVAVIGYNASGSPDTIALLILKTLNAGTTFYVSDNEVASVGGTAFADVGEVEATFTVKSGQTIPAGTVVILPWGNQTVTSSLYDWTGHTSGGLGASGGTSLDDGIYIYTGTSATALTPTAFIYHVKGSASSAANAGNIPAGLTLGTTAIAPSANLARYKTSGATYSGSVAQILAAIGNTASNWESASPGAASDWTFTFTAPQTITFDALAAKTFGDADFTLSATASSGLTVAFASSNTSVATVSGNTVHIVGAGSTTITASQAGNSSYSAATNVTQTLTVDKANQTITFGALANRTYGDAPFDLTATASSGQPVSYASSNSAVATVTGSTVTIVGAGSATITASQAGSANFNAAVEATQSLTMEAKALVVTANHISKPYGATLTGGAGSQAFTTTGLVGSDTVGSVTVSYGAGAASDAAAGTYEGSVIASNATGGTFAPANYTITYVAGNITVSAAPTASLSGTLAAVDTTYGSPSPAPTSFTVSGGNLMGNLTVAAPTAFEVSTSPTDN
ncbi:MAG: beta strand repeat-containing protein, partial [Roseimicrobium sp.]